MKWTGLRQDGTSLRRNRTPFRRRRRSVGLFLRPKAAPTDTHSHSAAFYIYSAMCGSLVATLYIFALQLLD